MTTRPERNSTENTTARATISRSVSQGPSREEAEGSYRAHQHLERAIRQTRDDLAALLGVTELLIVHESDDVKSLAEHVTRLLSAYQERLSDLLEVLELLEVRATPELLADYPQFIAALNLESSMAAAHARNSRREAVTARREALRPRPVDKPGPRPYDWGALEEEDDASAEGTTR